jgi:predicted  nucleic acid-binding Zn-ribbon protein
MTAVLENIEQQNRATIEAVFASERRMTEMFEARFQNIERRLDALEFAVRKNPEDIRKNSEDLVKLQSEVRRMADVLGADRDENVISALERRVTALEQRLGVGSTS